MELRPHESSSPDAPSSGGKRSSETTAEGVSVAGFLGSRRRSKRSETGPTNRDEGQQGTVSMEGDAGAKVAKNLQRIALGLVSIDDLGPGYTRTPQGIGLRVEEGTFPLNELEPVVDGHFA